MKFTFNTGRFYTEAGQIIEVEVIGDIVYFHDTSRMIDGHFKCMEQGSNERRLKEVVMLAYDNSMFTYGKPR